MISPSLRLVNSLFKIEYDIFKSSLTQIPNIYSQKDISDTEDNIHIIMTRPSTLSEFESSVSINLVRKILSKTDNQNVFKS